MVAAACLACFLLTLTATLTAGYRVWVHQPQEPARERDRPHFPVWPRDWLSAIEWIGAAAPFGEERRAEARRKLVSAGYRLPECTSIYFGLKACLALALPALICPFLYAIRPDAFAVAFAGSLAAYTGFRLPSWFIGFTARNRQQAIRDALPDLIDLLVISVESGLSLDEGIRDATHALAGVHPDLTEELHIYRLELGAGTGRSDALRNLARRTGEPHLRRFGALLIQTERFGTGISRVLRTQARLMRARRRQRSEELANQLAVKMIFPIFFLIMPSTFLVTAGPAVLYLFGDLRKMLGTD